MMTCTLTGNMALQPKNKTAKEKYQVSVQGLKKSC